MTSKRKVTILTYHKVGCGEDAISEKLFTFHLLLIKFFFNYVPISQVCDYKNHKNLPRNAISISFDDGYSSFPDKALPKLLKFGFKPTLFLSSGYLDKSYMWNDVAAINGFDTSKIKYLNLKERKEILKNFSAVTDDPLITSSKLKEIATIVDIGGHTLDHPILALENDESAEYQILNDKIKIESIIGRSVSLFAYPNGKYGYDFNENTINIVKKSGYSYAFTTEPFAYKDDEFSDYIIPRVSTPKKGLISSLKFFLSLYIKDLSPKVILFESGKGFGGATLSAFEITETFPRKSGVNLRTCISSLSGKYEIFKNNEHVDLVEFSKIEWHNPKNKIINIFKFCGNILRATHYLTKQKAKLVYLNNDPYNNLHIVAACKILNIKYLIHHRGIISNTKITKYVIRNAELNIVISKSVEERIKNVDCNVKTKLIYNGFTPIPNGTAVKQSPNKILMIAGFYGWKGQFLVLEAFEKIAAFNDKASIEFIGLNEELSELENQFLDKVALSKYSNRITVSKFTNKISDMILNSDIIIHASTEPEPFGRVVVEGMSAKKIVIASNIGGPAEIISDSINGFLFDPFVKNDLVRVLTEIYTDKYNLELISQKAFERSKDFDKFKNSAEIKKIILKHLQNVC